MKEEEINERILRVYGSVIISKSQANLLTARMKDEGDVEITLIGGVEGNEVKPTHTEGKLDRILKVKAIRISNIKNV